MDYEVGKTEQKTSDANAHLAAIVAHSSEAILSKTSRRHDYKLERRRDASVWL